MTGVKPFCITNSGY